MVFQVTVILIYSGHPLVADAFLSIYSEHTRFRTCIPFVRTPITLKLLVALGLHLAL